LDPLLKNLRKAGICASRPVFRPLHWDVPCSGKFPQADLAWRESLSLPLYPVLTGREQDEIIQKMVLLLRDLKG